MGITTATTATELQSARDLLESLPGNRAASLRDAMADAFGGGTSAATPMVAYDFSWVVGGEEAAVAGQMSSFPSSAAAAAASAAADRPLIVDIGSGDGGRALGAILAENPAIPASRCVLQGRAEAIREVDDDEDEDDDLRE